MAGGEGRPRGRPRTAAGDREWRRLSAPEAADWVREVDDSPYGWPEWVDAVLILADLLIREGRRPSPFPTVVGYVGCAAAGERATSVVPPLPELVAEAYREFGFGESGENGNSGA